MKRIEENNRNCELIKIRTVLQNNDAESGLSFFEEEHDIPFKIHKFYVLLDKERMNEVLSANNRCLLFCPFGVIGVDVVFDDECKTVRLDDPSIGMIVDSDSCISVEWVESGGVLCVATEENEIR